MSSGTVLFVENFHAHLAWPHRTRGNGLSGQGRFSAVHALRHVLMFGASLSNGFATWCVASAQSGCLTFGSLLANPRRQSAIRHRLVNCPSCGGQCEGGRWQANAQQTSRSRGFATPGWRSKSCVLRSQASRPSPSWRVAIARSPGIIEYWPGGQASGKMSANQIEGDCRCNGQTSKTKGRSSCSQRPLLRAPA